MFPMMPYLYDHETEIEMQKKAATLYLDQTQEINDEYRQITPTNSISQLNESDSSSCRNGKEYLNELFQYQLIGNKSPSVDSKVDMGIVKPMASTKTYQTNHDDDTEKSPIKKLNINDQKLPKLKQKLSKNSSFIYVNKNGYAKLLQADEFKNDTIDSKINKFNKSGNEQFEIRLNTSENHSVPTINPNNQSISSASSSTASSIVQTNTNGQVQINTSQMMNEEYIDIKPDHVKYISLIAILCCWCFPCTGIPAIIYSRLLNKFYTMHDMVRAKNYLLKSERFVLATFFFGFTLIALIFAVLEVYLFNPVSTNISNSSNIVSFRGFIPH